MSAAGPSPSARNGNSSTPRRAASPRPGSPSKRPGASGALSPRKDQLSMEQLLEKLQTLEKYKLDEEKGRKTEETKRKKEVASVKKSFSREISATKSVVRKRNMEVAKLRAQLAKIEAKQYDSAQKKTRTASQLDEFLHKADKEHSQLEVELQSKLQEVEGAKGTLAYLEYAKDALEKGGVVLDADPGAKAITQDVMESTNGTLHAEIEEHRLCLQNDADIRHVALEQEMDLLRNELIQMREENEGLRVELDRERATVRVQEERIEHLRAKLRMATTEMRQKVARIEELTEPVSRVNPEMQMAMEELNKQMSVTELVVLPPEEDLSAERAIGYTLPAGYSAGSIEDLLKEQTPERSVGHTSPALGPVEDLNSSPEQAVGYRLPSGYSAGSLQEVPATTFMRKSTFQDEVFEVPHLGLPHPQLLTSATAAHERVTAGAAVHDRVTAGAMAAAALPATRMPAGAVPRGAGGIAVSTSSNNTPLVETPLTIAHGYNANLSGTPRAVATLATARPHSTPRMRPPGASGSLTVSAGPQPRTNSPLSHGFNSPLRPTASASASSVHRWPTPRAVVSVPTLPHPPYAMASGAPQALRQASPGAPQALRQASQDATVHVPETPRGMLHRAAQVGQATDASARERSRGRTPVFAANPSTAGAEYGATRRPASSSRVVAVTATPPVAGTSLPSGPIVMPPVTVCPAPGSKSVTVPVAPPGSNSAAVPVARQRPLSAGATRTMLTGRHEMLPARPERHINPATRGSAPAAHERSAPTLGSESVSAAPSVSLVSEASETRPILSDTTAKQHLEASGAERSSQHGFAEAVHKVTAQALREYRQHHRGSAELQNPFSEEAFATPYNF